MLKVSSDQAIKSKARQTQQASIPTDTRISDPRAASNAREHNRFFRLCHFFAVVKQLWENESCHLGQNEVAGLKSKSGPPGNMNALKHGRLAAIQKRRSRTVNGFS
jgi:hypothetical protein